MGRCRREHAPELQKLKGGWIVGGYLSNWVAARYPDLLKNGFRVVQDILPNALTESADILLPSAWIQKMDTDLEKSFGLKDSKGALVSKVQKDSPAGKAGIKPGDIILKVDGKGVGKSKELLKVVNALPIGKEIESHNLLISCFLNDPIITLNFDEALILS